jgi:DNA-binding NtrC family response regulator
MPAKILLVEDESITRASIADVLRNDGFEVEEARDGAQALQIFGRQRFDLVITDFVMPELNGFKLIARVHSFSPLTPVILITAYLSKDSGQAILQGTAEFIGKPIDLDVLLETVKHTLMPPVN